ncbi:glycosyltransferase family 2 protein [Paraburkholderia sp. Ac-20340]|uniref:glycosyltransferase family 2 protein n=1 Tax=Paraburkholderia sp. Ac-20340 TaxID=2703888 RepID=UPI001982397F|nr:glycosyltransferase family 2 protein [Paraburkholderia sp. Ac-20340]MBN3851780.1 glycosyltransferase family 2 protein [Paraburkholderia sp. Ac-20340]
MRAGALVILFHPSGKQLARLRALREACAALVVIDNTPQADASAREAARRDGYTLIHHGNRGGIAGAYNVGLTHLFARDPKIDAVALFDQDSVVPPAYFPTMDALAARLAGRAFIAGPRIFDENDGRFLPELATNGIGVRRLQVDTQQGTPAPMRCAFLISSGSFVSREAWKALGRFDEALFIDHVDTEYCFRALARNVPLYLVPALVLRHRIGAKARRRVGPLEIATMNHAWTRRYYSARNAMQIAIQYGPRFPVALVPNLLTLWQIVQIVLGEQDKRAKLKGIFYGLLDGFLGRLGPLDASQPRWIRRVTLQERRG